MKWIQCILDKVEVVKSLLENHADRSIKNFNQKTVKDLATERGEWIDWFINRQTFNWNFVFLGYKRISELFQTEIVAQRGNYAQQACDWFQKDSYDRILGGEQANPGEFPWMVFNLAHS